MRMDYGYVYYSKSIAIKVNNKNPIDFNVRRIKIYGKNNFYPWDP